MREALWTKTVRRTDVDDRQGLAEFNGLGHCQAAVGFGLGFYGLELSDMYSFTSEAPAVITQSPYCELRKKCRQLVLIMYHRHLMKPDLLLQ